MIGSLLAIKFAAKKSWQIAIAFWAIYLIIGLFGIGIIVTAFPFPVIGIFLSFLLFMALAVGWLKIAPMLSLISFAVAYLIDWIILFFLATIGVTITSLTGGI